MTRISPAITATMPKNRVISSGFGINFSIAITIVTSSNLYSGGLSFLRPREQPFDHR